MIDRNKKRKKSKIKDTINILGLGDVELPKDRDDMNFYELIDFRDKMKREHADEIKAYMDAAQAKYEADRALEIKREEEYQTQLRKAYKKQEEEERQRQALIKAEFDKMQHNKKSNNGFINILGVGEIELPTPNMSIAEIKEFKEKLQKRLINEIMTGAENEKKALEHKFETDKAYRNNILGLNLSAKEKEDRDNKQRELANKEINQMEPLTYIDILVLKKNRFLRAKYQEAVKRWFERERVEYDEAKAKGKKIKKSMLFIHMNNLLNIINASNARRQKGVGTIPTTDASFWYMKNMNKLLASKKYTDLTRSELENFHKHIAESLIHNINLTAKKPDVYKNTNYDDKKVNEIPGERLTYIDANLVNNLPDLDKEITV